MIELSDHLLLMQKQAREWAGDMRSIALDLDRDPNEVYRHLELPVIACMAVAQIPPEYNPSPTICGGRPFYGMTALERVVLAEELACGDAGMLLACPGAPMSGLLVSLLGNRQQKEWFYGRLVEEFTWTFFALTESGHGSDASGMQTELKAAEDAGSLRLNGAKRYIGNATRAQIGVVFARMAPGPLGLGAVLVETSAAGFAAEAIDTLGLRGAQLAAITLADVRVPSDRVLGLHLPPSRRGVWAWVQIFNLLRPSVAAMGVGIARSAHEYVLANRGSLRTQEREALDAQGRRISSVRQLVLRAAVRVDRDSADGGLASAAKVQAARLARNVTIEALGFFGPGARVSHPLLDKFARDALGIEFMEGTSNVQKLSLFQQLLKGPITRERI